MLKNYIDLSGLEYFRDSLLVDDIASGASDTVHAPSVKSVLDYIDSVKVHDIVEPGGTGLATEAAVVKYVDPQFDLVSESITGIEDELASKFDSTNIATYDGSGTVDTDIVKMMRTVKNSLSTNPT